uniref:ACB domain-containing protein n=1 Tax=Periophthalmus magnuspinnatus TaxID=409849 RepID=A0A3B4B9X6_9GOBI
VPHFYCHFKQFVVVQNAPGMFSFVAKEKWNAWNAKKGLSKEDAEVEYIKVVESLKEKYGI